MTKQKRVSWNLASEQLDGTLALRKRQEGPRARLKVLEVATTLHQQIVVLLAGSVVCCIHHLHGAADPSAAVPDACAVFWYVFICCTRTCDVVHCTLSRCMQIGMP